MPNEIEAKLPEDVEAEKVILSALMTGHSESVEAVERLEPGFFHHPGNVIIFTVLKELWNTNQPVDLPAVVGHLGEKKELEAVGGAPYVSSIVSPEYHVKRLEKYLHRVCDMAGRRAIVFQMERIKSLALEANEVNAPEGTAAELAWMAAQELAEIKALYYPERFTSPNDAAKSLIMDLHEKDGPHAARTGIPRLDEVTGGFQPGELVIVTAETGAGKTYFVLQVRMESCRAGKHVLFCSGEMRAKHLVGRELAGRTGVSYSKIRSRTVTDSELQRLTMASLESCKECVLLDSDLSLRNIRSAAAKLGKKNTSLIIVDYDELVEVKGDDEWDEQRVLVRSLKALAMEREVPVIMVSQLRKVPTKEEAKTPSLHRLYGSGAKSKHASIVLYIDRPFVREITGDETAATVWVLKNRDGKLDRVPCRFNIKTGRFDQEVSREQ